MIVQNLRKNPSVLALRSGVWHNMLACTLNHLVLFLYGALVQSLTLDLFEHGPAYLYQTLVGCVERFHSIDLDHEIRWVSVLLLPLSTFQNLQVLSYCSASAADLILITTSVSPPVKSQRLPLSPRFALHHLMRVLASRSRLWNSNLCTTVRMAQYKPIEFFVRPYIYTVWLIAATERPVPVVFCNLISFGCACTNDQICSSLCLFTPAKRVVEPTSTLIKVQHCWFIWILCLQICQAKIYLIAKICQMVKVIVIQFSY